MHKVSIVLTGKGEGLSILTKRGLLPDQSTLTGIPLKKPDLVLSSSNFFYLKKKLKPINDWRWVPVKNLKKLEKNYGEILCEALGKCWEIMPGFKLKISQPFLFKKANFKNEVIFFPGSFNPFHRGHKECLILCPKKSKIIIVPDNNPWKPVRGDQCKWKIYRDICLKVKDLPCSIYPGFLGLKKINPTVEWFPKTSVPKKGLLLGDDNFLKLIDWKESKKLISSINHIFVVPRIGREELMKETRTTLLKINPKIKISFLSSHKYQKISSTIIRGN